MTSATNLFETNKNERCGVLTLPEWAAALDESYATVKWMVRQGHLRQADGRIRDTDVWIHGDDEIVARRRKAKKAGDPKLGLLLIADVLRMCGVRTHNGPLASHYDRRLVITQFVKGNVPAPHACVGGIWLWDHLRLLEWLDERLKGEIDHLTEWHQTVKDERAALCLQ